MSSIQAESKELLRDYFISIFGLRTYIYLQSHDYLLFHILLSYCKKQLVGLSWPSSPTEKYIKRSPLSAFILFARCCSLNANVLTHSTIVEQHRLGSSVETSIFHSPQKRSFSGKWTRWIFLILIFFVSTFPISDVCSFSCSFLHIEQVAYLLCFLALSFCSTALLSVRKEENGRWSSYSLTNSSQHRLRMSLLSKNGEYNSTLFGVFSITNLASFARKEVNGALLQTSSSTSTEPVWHHFFRCFFLL